MINTLKHRLNDMHIFTKLFLFCLAICFSIALISGVIVYNQCHLVKLITN